MEVVGYKTHRGKEEMKLPKQMKPGGRVSDGQGYVMIWKPDHSHRTKENYVKEHRLIWEQHHKASLLPWAHIHHINGIRDDNRIENLQGLTHGQHTSITHAKDHSDKICGICYSTKTIVEKGIRKNWPHWRRDPEDRSKWMCHKCYQNWRRKNKI